MRRSRRSHASLFAAATIAIAAASCTRDAPSPSPGPVRTASVASVAHARAPTARVTLPSRASDAVAIADVGSGVAAQIALRGAESVPATERDGVTRFAAAFAGGDVTQRTTDAGFEDWVEVRERPAREELVYDVDVAHASAVRFVAASGELELLDAAGAPRLRMLRPRLVDAHGASHAATVSVAGCAYDASPLPPWRAPHVAPGAARCVVRVVWSLDADAYPLLVDPTWTTTGSLATPRRHFAGASLISGQVLVAGGTDLNGFTTPTAEIYDPATGTFASTGAMTTPRAYHTLETLASGQVLAAGGIDDTDTTLASAETYDPASGVFTATAQPMSVARAKHATQRLASGDVLVVGGLGSTGGKLPNVDLYDPGTRAFTATGPLATGRFQPTVSLLASGKVLVAGGLGNAGYLAKAELYDPTLGAFSATGDMTVARVDHAATVLPSGKVLVTGGDNATSPYYLQSAELYDPSTGGFTATTTTMTTKRANHTSTLLRSGKVLVAAGQSLGFADASAELYDPATDRFSATASLAIPRYEHVAALLPSGEVLVAGGYNNAGQGAVGSAELYAVVAAGGACAIGDDCVSGLCDDGVCCAAACPNGGVCQTCAAATGACVTVTNAVDPDTCSGTNVCDGAGACKRVVGQPCPGGAGDCANGTCVDGFCCDGACAGACDVCAASLGAPANGTCGPASAGYAGSPACGGGFACDGSSATCPSGSCVADADCLPADYCGVDGACHGRKAQGAKCDPARGADCKTAGCRDCASGNCVDGVCCDTACDGLCLACTKAAKQDGSSDGSCGPARAGTNPHADACPVDPPSSCGRDGTCNGSGACTLFYPAGTVCAGEPSCAAGRAQAASACNGSGDCVTPATIECGAFACKGTACATSCDTDADCASNARCDAATKTCIATGASCDGAHTVTSPNGTRTDCSPYTCEGNGCKASCGSVSDCADPFVCDPSGHCVARPPDPPTDVASCTIARAGAGTPRPPLGGALLVVLSALLGVARAVRRIAKRS